MFNQHTDAQSSSEQQLQYPHYPRDGGIAPSLRYISHMEQAKAVIALVLCELCEFTCGDVMVNTLHRYSGIGNRVALKVTDKALNTTVNLHTMRTLTCEEHVPSRTDGSIFSGVKDLFVFGGEDVM